MNESLDLLAEHQPDGSVVLSTPLPGLVRFSRKGGEVLVPGSAVGVLVIDQRCYQLLVPAGVHGQLPDRVPEHAWVVCGYGSRLAEVSPYAGRSDAAENEPSAEEAARGYVVRAPSHGTFYRSAGPGQPNFVEVGQRVEAGQTVGLVEVMKCFSPIAFVAPAGLEFGVVREVLAGDGVEVKADQALVRITPS